MKKASMLNFKNQKHGAGGSITIIKTMWYKFGFSHLLLSIDKHSGLSAWKFVFAYITGLVANCSSVNKIAEHCTKSPIIREILGEIASVSFPDIFIKLPEMQTNKKGIMVRKQVYTPVAAVATIRLPEDMDKEQVVIDIANPDDKVAHFKGAYLLISNRVNSPEQAVIAYANRWKI